jgi:hypothetical protein
MANPLSMPAGYQNIGGNMVAQGGHPLMMGAGYKDMPATAMYNQIYNPDTMSSLPMAQKQIGGINLNPLQSSVQNFADLANRKGPSQFATEAGQQQNQLANMQTQNGLNMNNAQTAGALSSLGSSGGLTSGARERAAEGGAQNAMNMSQGIANQNNQNQMQIGMNDAQNKMQEMGMLPGMESQALAPEFQKATTLMAANNQDIGNQMNQNQSANAWNQNMYNQQMQAWGAKQQADATANQGKK